MLCTTLLNASMCILTSLKRPYQELIKECNSADAIMYPYVKDEDTVSTLKANFEELNEIQSVEVVKYHYITEDILHDGKKLDCFANLTLYNEAIFGGIRNSRENLKAVHELGTGECYMPLCIANEGGIQVGDTIQISFSTGVVSLKVVGLFAEPYSTATAFDSYILVNRLPNNCFIRENLFLFIKDGYSSMDVEEAYRNANNGMLEGQINSVNDIIANGLLTGNIMGGMFLAIGLIMLVVSALIINFMVRNNMHQDAKNIAVYKTMGYEHPTILKMYLFFYTSITLAGCVAGILLSMFVANRLLANIYCNIGKIASVNPFVSGVPCLLLTCLFVMLIVSFLVNRTKNVKPVYAFNGMEHTNSKKKSYHGNSRLQFSPFGIAIRRMTRNKKGVIGILITTITTVFSINFAVIALDIALDMKNQNDYWLGVDRSDVVVTVADEESQKKVETILQNDLEVEHYMNVSMGSEVVMLPWKKDLETNTMYVFVYDDFEHAKLPVVEGRNPQAVNEIAISTKMAEVTGKEVGDYIEVYLGGEVKTELMISGLFQTYYSLGKSCRLLKSSYEVNDYPRFMENYSIYLKDGVELDHYIDQLTKELGTTATVTKRTEMFPSIMNMIVKPQESAIPALVVLVCIIGGMNIFSIVMLKNKEEEKRNCIYKSMGYTTGHLICANLIYVLLVAIVCCIIALPLNLFTFEPIMKFGLSMFGFRSYPTSFNFGHLLICNALILVAFSLCTLVSSRTLKNIHVKNLVCE